MGRPAFDRMRGYVEPDPTEPREARKDPIGVHKFVGNGVCSLAYPGGPAIVCGRWPDDPIHAPSDPAVPRSDEPRRTVAITAPPYTFDVPVDEDGTCPECNASPGEDGVPRCTHWLNVLLAAASPTTSPAGDGLLRPGDACAHHRRMGFVYSVLGCPKCYPALASPAPAPEIDVERLARAWGNLEDNDGFLHAADIDDLTAEYARLPASPLSPQTAPETKP